MIDTKASDELMPRKPSTVVALVRTRPPVIAAIIASAQTAGHKVVYWHHRWKKGL